jgi:hypothetical protein
VKSRTTTASSSAESAELVPLPPTSTPFTLVSYNVDGECNLKSYIHTRSESMYIMISLAGLGQNKRPRERVLRCIVPLLMKERPAVIAFQEITHKFLGELVEAMSSQYIEVEDGVHIHNPYFTKGKDMFVSARNAQAFIV